MSLQQLAEKTVGLLPTLRCPQCGTVFSLRDHRSLVCASGHCFDLSRKGYINLAPGHNQQAEKYDADLFESRRQVLDRGFYTPVMEALERMIRSHVAMPDGPFALLDAGCGEGTYARFLSVAFPAAQVLGVDLSRDAIHAAAKSESQVHWLVGDLKRLPVKNGSINALLNLLTPADYQEFGRVLAPEGILIKVIPGKEYLRQIRQGAQPLLKRDGYDNVLVLEHLSAHADILARETLQYTLPVSPEEATAFQRMTPMTFGLTPSALSSLSFSEITIHLEILCCRVKRLL